MSNAEDTREFVRLFSQHEPGIRGCVLLLVPNWNDAQDITQRVSLILWKKFEQFQPGSNFLAWAIQIAKNEAKAHWKRQLNQQRLFSDPFVDVVAEDAGAMMEEIDQRRALLKYCMDLLKPAHRELLYLKYEQEETVDVIAERMSRSVDAIYKSIARLRTALLDCVNRRAALVNRR